ncbi:MAG TPA: site-specific DNA-methyltransferase, partial [Brevefilum sp.]|nr:site-specific DNA-methyltransferase [Brevefilum sp.]
MPSQSYGPDNPHPFSTIRTELIWEGKYDEYGNRRQVDVAGAAMPLQKIETVDEPRSRAEVQGLLFEPQKAHRDDFRNMLVWGDNKLVMASLLKDFKGKIDLIYIDPPFDVGADFTMSVPIGEEKDQVGKDQSTLEMVAYRDMWGRGTDSYLHMMYERLLLMRELLNENGSIYVHCDWRVNSLLRLIMDEIFGSNKFVNHIIWHYYNKYSAASNCLPRAHDDILFYKNSDNLVLNEVREIRDTPVKQLVRVNVGGILKNARDDKGNLIYRVSTDKKIDDVWRIPQLQPASTEWTGFATQKHHDLLTRIIIQSSNEGDLVADFFCGSGTTGAVAERLGRRWIMADLGRFAIHTSRKRMIELQRTLHAENQPYRSFDVYNLGRYERQWWQKEALEGA